MTHSFEQIERLSGEQEHQFLNYQRVHIHFIYSFTWDISKATWNELQRDLLGESDDPSNVKAPSHKGWKLRRLHERGLEDGEVGLGPTYQPNLVTQKDVLEKNGLIADCAIILVPIEEYRGIAVGKCVEIPISLKYTVRVFDNGGATCTFEATLKEEATNFENIHMVLHLAQNVDFGDVSDSPHKFLTNAFIKTPLPEGTRYDHTLLPETPEDSYWYENGYCTLHDLFRRLLCRPPSWAPQTAPELWNDREVIDTRALDQDFQSPFVFTVAQIDRDSFLRLRKTPTINTTKEVSSILTKLTLDNRHIKTDFLFMSKNYINQVLRSNKERDSLTNLCLDRRLFFTISKRGCIAISTSLDGMPSFFVTPSLLNLLEILRIRWHMSVVVNSRLDEAIKTLSVVPNRDSQGSTSDLLNDLYKWRCLFAAFLRDPVVFLFDGGSVTDLARVAEREFGLISLRENTYRKFSLLDQLVREYLNINLEREIQETQQMSN